MRANSAALLSKFLEFQAALIQDRSLLQLMSLKYDVWLRYLNTATGNLPGIDVLNMGCEVKLLLHGTVRTCELVCSTCTCSTCRSFALRSAYACGGSRAMQTDMPC
jgi:hypothetical protein